MNLVELLLSGKPANRLALVGYAPDGGEVAMTYGDLSTLVNRFSATFAEQGVVPESRVAILGDNSVTHVAALLGIMAIGAIACPLGSRAGQDVLKHCLDDCDPQLIVSDTSLGFIYPAAVLNPADILPTTVDPVSIYQPETDSIAIILYTSGSTGLPKGVPITHHGYVWAICHYLELQLQGRRALVAAPLYHMNAQFSLLLNLASGVSTVLMPRFDARKFGALIERYSIDEISGVPTMLAMLAREVDQGLAINTASVSAISIGSAPLGTEASARFRRLFPNASIDNGYGTTESGPVSFGPHPKDLVPPPASLGAASAAVDIKLVGSLAPSEGELWIRTPMTNGYWRNPAATAAKFQDRWYKTGDILTCDADGFYFFAGRTDDIINCGGEKIAPSAIEQILEAHFAVTSAVVVAVPDPIKGEVPVAFVVVNAGAQPDMEELKMSVIAAGVKAGHPRHIWPLAVFPCGATEKIDRRALRAEALKRLQA